MRNEKTVTFDRLLLLGVLVVQAFMLYVFMSKDQGAQPSSTQSENIITEREKFNNESMPMRLPSSHSRKAPARVSPQEQAERINDIFDQMQKEMDTMMDRAYIDFERIDRLMSMDDNWGNLNRSPTLDLKELKDSYVLTMSLPGIDLDDIEIAITGRLLTIKSHYELANSSGRRSQQYMNRILLPGSVKEEEVSTEVSEKGIIRITIHKEVTKSNEMTITEL